MCLTHANEHLIIVFKRLRRKYMRVRAIDTVSARSDGKPRVTSITDGVVYEVVAIEGDKYVILSDCHKLTRHSQYRFEVVDSTSIPSIRKAYNSLTHPIRMEAKCLRERVEELEAKLKSINDIIDGDIK